MNENFHKTVLSPLCTVGPATHLDQEEGGMGQGEAGMQRGLEV